MDLSVQNLLKIARRWWWLLLLAPLIAGGIAFFQVSRQQELYRSSATIEITPPTTNADTFSFYDTSIVATYRELITTSAVLQPLIERLDLPYTETELRNKVTISPITDTRLMRISVSDADPATAARLANEIAGEFAEYSKERAAQIAGPYLAALQEQIDETEQRIATTQRLMENIQSDESLSETEMATQLELQQANLDNLESTLRDLRLDATRLEIEANGAQTSVLVVQQANVPNAPYAPNVQLYTLLAAFAGLCIAIGAIAIYEYLDNTTKAETPYNEITGSSLLATVPTVPKLKERFHQLFVLNSPRSPASEAVRLLRANVEFAAASEPISTLTISSSGPGEGKSTITANLAIAMAQAGYDVTLVDGDLRRPSQHKIFELPNKKGLSTLLAQPGAAWQSMSYRIPNLKLTIMTSGPIPPNAADLLRSQQFASLLETLKEHSDIVLIDTPPILAASDALVVSASTDAMLFICQAETTRIDRLAQAVDALPETVRIAGVVLNQQSVSRKDAYYYIYYTEDDSGTGEEIRQAPVAQAPSRMSSWFRRSSSDSRPARLP